MCYFWYETKSQFFLVGLSYNNSYKYNSFYTLNTLTETEMFVKDDFSVLEGCIQLNYTFFASKYWGVQFYQLCLFFYATINITLKVFINKHCYIDYNFV